MDTETAKTVAIKRIGLRNISQENIKQIETEINLLKKLDHSNIVKYYDFIQTKTHINIILEYVEGGSLQTLVKQNGMLGEYIVYVFVKQILEGLDYLHSQGIIHRDIKGANLLYTKNGVIKLADFGYSTKLTDKEKTNSIVGTPFWMAPEVIEQKGNISPACDIWSLGSTIIQLLTTVPPYYDFPALGAIYRIVTDDHPPLPENISEHLADFLSKCFVKDSTKRPSASELLSHPWITTPNKKIAKKFIHDNDTNILPGSLINELKNNYKNNFSSMTSSQNEKIEIIDEEENHDLNDEEFKGNEYSQKMRIGKKGFEANYKSSSSSKLFILN